MRIILAFLICLQSFGAAGCSRSASKSPPKSATRELTEAEQAAILRGSLDAAKAEFQAGKYRALFGRIDPACRAALLERLAKYNEFGPDFEDDSAGNSDAVVIPLRSMVPFVPKSYLLREPTEDEPDPWSAVNMPEYFASIMRDPKTRGVRWSIERVLEGRMQVVDSTEERVKLLVRDPDGFGQAETTMWLVRKDGNWYLNFQVPPLR